MALPVSAQRKAEEANRLSKEAAAALAAPDLTRTPEPAPSETTNAELEKLRADLATANEALAREKQFHRQIRGKYDAEVPRLAAEVKTLSEQVKAAETERTRKIEAGELTSLSDAERGVAGEDLVQVIAKAAREVAASEIERRLKPITERVDSFQRMSEANYNATLDREAPFWVTQNDDPRFIAWLQEVDPETGRLRDDLLQRAHASMQGFRTVEIFLAFKEGREIGARAPTPPKANPQSPSPDQDSAGGEPVLTDDASKSRVWTRAQISEFYADKRKGVYKGKVKEAEGRELETDITAAYAEGRIRG
jgi:hypothetical protein